MESGTLGPWFPGQRGKAVGRPALCDSPRSRSEADEQPEVPYSLDLSEPCAELIRCTSFFFICLEVMTEADPSKAELSVRVLCGPRVCRCQETAPASRGPPGGRAWGGAVSGDAAAIAGPHTQVETQEWVWT